MTQELITAADLETQASLQRVKEMKIVETRDGYELHVPLRAWLPHETTIREAESGPQVVINLSEPTWRILRTRRAKEPRMFKNLITIFSYIEEKFPSVKNVEVKILSREETGAKRPATKAPAGKASGRKTAKAAKKAPAKTTKAGKKPARKATKAR